MAYVQAAQQRLIVPATTYAPTYDPEAGPSGQRARPTSYAAPYASPYDVENQPQYPKTAYPFTGYTVVSIRTAFLFDIRVDIICFNVASTPFTQIIKGS
jgi:hypothetical protein